MWNRAQDIEQGQERNKTVACRGITGRDRLYACHPCRLEGDGNLQPRRALSVKISKTGRIRISYRGAQLQPFNQSLISARLSAFVDSKVKNMLSTFNPLRLAAAPILVGIVTLLSACENNETSAIKIKGKWLDYGNGAIDLRTVRRITATLTVIPTTVKGNDSKRCAVAGKDIMIDIITNTQPLTRNNLDAAIKNVETYEKNKCDWAAGATIKLDGFTLELGALSSLEGAKARDLRSYLETYEKIQKQLP